MKFNSKLIAEIAIMAALAFALDFIQGPITRGLFPNGGSIGIAMLPILILSYRRGFIYGFLAGLILSFIQMLGGVYLSADQWYMIILQLLLDYILAYPLVAFAGIFREKYLNSENKTKKNAFLIYGVILGGFLKIVCHYLAGVIFWSSSCPEGYFGGAYVYSFVYNSSYMIPNIILNALILVLMANKFHGLLNPNEK